MPAAASPDATENLKRCSRCRGRKSEDQFATSDGKPRETCTECRAKDVIKRKRRATREQRERELSSARPAPAPPRPMSMGCSTFSMHDSPAFVASPQPKASPVSMSPPASEMPSAKRQKTRESVSSSPEEEEEVSSKDDTVSPPPPPPPVMAPKAAAKGRRSKASKAKTQQSMPPPPTPPQYTQQMSPPIASFRPVEVPQHDNQQITYEAPAPPPQNFFSWGGMRLNAMPISSSPHDGEEK